MFNGALVAGTANNLCIIFSYEDTYLIFNCEDTTGEQILILNLKELIDLHFLILKSKDSHSRGYLINFCSFNIFVNGTNCQFC